MPEEINYAIYLSYEDLPSRLKQCFLHFSLIPKGLTLSVDNIVSMWISEGFVHGSTNKLEELGSEYHDELISRNLIEPDKKHVSPQCTMHDVIRSFAQFVAKDEALVVANNREIDVTSKLTSHKFFRLSLHTVGLESSQLEWSSLEAQKSLRTLLSFVPLKTKRGDTLGIFPSLRALYLDGTDCRALVESLYQLKHLRYLSMDGCGLSKLPENIGKMKFLQCIDISNNKSLAKLPDSFVELHQLRFLVLYNTGISNIPKGFHRLNNLMTLAGFPAHMNGEWCSLEELGALSQLCDLTIKGLENVDASSYARKARINGKLHLRHLNLNCSTRQGDDTISEEEQRRIEGVFDELCPPPCLEILAIIGYFSSRLPRWMMSIASGLPRSMRTLLMNDLACCTELPDGLCQLPFLEEIWIRSAPAIKRVGPAFLQPCHHGDHHVPQPQVVAAFPRLLRLTFDGMLVWEEWEWEEQVQAMPNLEMLTLERCKLRCIPPGLAFQAKSLRLLCVHNVKHLSSLENLPSVVQLHVLQCHDLERIENLWKLQKLRINTCPKMKVLKGVPALERLGLQDYTMKTLPGYLQDVKPRHFELEDCTLLLLTAIAARRSGPEWDKFSHIQHVKAYAAEDCIPRKRFVLYTRDPFSFQTNASSSDIARVLLYTTTCTIEDECLVGGQYANENKCQPLCLRFRWNSYRHLSSWLSQVCLDCKDAACVVSSSGPE